MMYVNMIFSAAFMGFAIFSSGFFTALNDGVISAAISFMRTPVFQVAAVIVLPIIFDVEGIWYSIVVAGFMASIVSAIFLIIMKKEISLHLTQTASHFALKMRCFRFYFRIFDFLLDNASAMCYNIIRQFIVKYF